MERKLNCLHCQTKWWSWEANISWSHWRQIGMHPLSSSWTEDVKWVSEDGANHFAAEWVCFVKTTAVPYDMDYDDDYTRALALGALCFKFLCVVGFKHRLSKFSRGSANFMSHDGWQNSAKSWFLSFKPGSNGLWVILMTLFFHVVRFDCR